MTWGDLKGMVEANGLGDDTLILAVAASYDVRARQTLVMDNLGVSGWDVIEQFGRPAIVLHARQVGGEIEVTAINSDSTTERRPWPPRS